MNNHRKYLIEQLEILRGIPIEKEDLDLKFIWVHASVIVQLCHPARAMKEALNQMSLLDEWLDDDSLCA